VNGVLVLLVAAIGPLVAPVSPYALVTLAYGKPSGGFLLGGDFLSRDVLARVLNGGWLLLVMAACATALGIASGAMAGVAAAYLRGRSDGIIMRVADVILSFPQLVFALLLLSLLGPKLWLIVIAVGISHTTQEPGSFGNLSLSERGVVLRPSHLRAPLVRVASGACDSAGQPLNRVFGRHMFPVGTQRLDARPQDVLASATVGGWTVGRKDLVLADDDGVLFVPATRAGDIVTLAETIRDTGRPGRTDPCRCLPAQPGAVRHPPRSAPADAVPESLRSSARRGRGPLRNDLAPHGEQPMTKRQRHCRARSRRLLKARAYRILNCDSMTV
jgi:hypothetical protein